MATKPIIEYFPNGTMTEYKFNNNGQILQWMSDGIHRPYFTHAFNGYFPYKNDLN